MIHVYEICIEAPPGGTFCVDFDWGLNLETGTDVHAAEVCIEAPPDEAFLVGCDEGPNLEPHAAEPCPYR